MGVSLRDIEAFGFICDKLEKMGYKVDDINIYMLSMSFFLVLDALFINKYKVEIAKLFNDTFQYFSDTSAFFVFGIKDDVEDVGKEITDDFLRKKKLISMDKQADIFYGEYNEVHKQNIKHMMVTFNIHMRKNIHANKKIISKYASHTYNSCEIYMMSSDIPIGRNYNA